MSASTALQPYDQVFDSQKHYRTLLQSTARPGTIGQLDDVLLEVPPQLNRATALLALTLFSSDSSFYLAQGEEPAIDFLRRETLAKPAGAEQADFLLSSRHNSTAGDSSRQAGKPSVSGLGRDRCAAGDGDLSRSHGGLPAAYADRAGN